MSILTHILGGREKQVQASEVAAHIQQLVPRVKSGTLRFWGIWFGRPHDNCHAIVRAEADGDCLTLHFNDEETLQIWHPTGCQIDEQQFVIPSATRVLWRWYWYGRPHAPGNLMSYDFFGFGAEVAFQSTFPYSHSRSPASMSQEFRFMDRPPNKSLQATRDGALTSASRFALVGPACLSSGS